VTPQQTRYLSMLAFAGFVGQVVIFALADWRERIERDVAATVVANTTTARDISYPVLAQQPRLTGLLIAAVVFAIGALLISGYRDTNETP